jgi:acyl carrier protein
LRMDKSDKNPIPFEEFKLLVAEQLHLEEDKVRREASFIDDLMVDSIQLVDLMLNLEELGINIPIEEAWDVRTVGDAYRLYQQHAT